MSELAYDMNGDAIVLPAHAQYWRVRRFRSPGSRGAPEVVTTREGAPMILPIDVGFIEFKETVENVPGRYRLDPIDDKRKLISNAPAAYLTIAELPPRNGVGLADGGAHSNFICDASTPTWMLTHWARDRTRGPRLELPYAVKKMTSDTARLFDFHDRGIVAPGMKADLNVIDFDALRLHEPKLVHDLPAGGSRLVQPASGYAATIVSGVVSRADDEFTGELPGRLVRS